MLLFVLGRLGRPEEPGDYHEKLQKCSRPQSACNANRAVRKQPAADSPHQQQQRRRAPTVPLHIVQRKQVLVGEQIAVDTRQHHARQRVVLERATRDGLPAALERHERQWQQYVPVHRLAVAGRRRQRHNGGRGDGEKGLRAEGYAENPATFRREVAMEAREEERPDAERQEGDARLPQSRVSGRVDERGEAEADIDGVSYVS